MGLKNIHTRIVRRYGRGLNIFSSWMRAHASKSVFPKDRVMKHDESAHCKIMKFISEKLGSRFTGKNNLTLRIESLGCFISTPAALVKKSWTKLSFRTAKAMELLAFLLSHPNQPVQKSLVLEKLFEGVVPAKAMRSLHLATHYLKLLKINFGRGEL